jgi:predicted RNA binding protein YcfA (HicA-like mRNA interferase family)
VTKLPLVSGRKLIDLLLHCGFEVKRSESSHYFLRHANGRTTVVPVHRNVDVHRSLLRQILSQAGIEHEDYVRLLSEI